MEAEIAAWGEEQFAVPGGRDSLAQHPGRAIRHFDGPPACFGQSGDQRQLRFLAQSMSIDWC